MDPRLLIVNDHASFRALARRLLALKGFDVQLPDLDGFGVAAALTAMRRGPVVVLVSSRSRDDYGDQVAGSDARGFIPKAELSGDALRRVLGRHLGP